MLAYILIYKDNEENGYKTYQNIKEARTSITMMNNNDITVWSCYYLPILKMSNLRLAGIK